MQKNDYYNDRINRLTSALLGLLLLCSIFPTIARSAEQGSYNENLTGYYAREGNDGSSARAAGNNIYIRFYADRWLGMMFLPYPYAESVATTATVPTCAALLANSTKKPRCTSKGMATWRIASFSNADRWRPAPSNWAMATWN